MFVLKLFFATAFVICTSGRYVDLQDQRHPLTIDDERHLVFDVEDPFLDHDYESYHPANLERGRVRRQTQGRVTINSDGSVGLGTKIPIAGGENNVLSAVGSYDLKEPTLNMQPASRGIGLTLDNVKGHSLTVMKQSVPGFGDRLTGAGKVNVFHNDNHDVSLRGSITKHMPNFPDVPNFNTVGGGVDYMYKEKVGASLDMSRTPFLDRKDYSAMGNLNLFKTDTSSVDLNAGFKKFDSPFMRSNWEPNFGLTFSRTFPNRF